MSEVRVDKLSPQSGTALTIGDSGDTITIPSGATITNSGTATGFGGGKVLQVQSQIYNTNSAISSGLGVQPTGLNVNITPSATTSKILVLAYTTAHVLNFGGITLGVEVLYRDATALSESPFGDYSGAGSVMGKGGNIMYLDSPSTTSTINYNLKAYALGTGDYHINDSGNVSGSNFIGSCITAMEIGV